MRERPILFSGDMVRAVLARRKTVTRRLVRFPKGAEAAFEMVADGSVHVAVPGPDGKLRTRALRCPYGLPRDRLWVKETWLPHEFDDHADIATYKADYPDGKVPQAVLDCRESGGRWQSGRFMPRDGSRITLEVLDVRIERLHEIDGDDIWREGVTLDSWDERVTTAARGAFADLWDRINARRPGGAPWGANPWVWRVAFQVVAVHGGGRSVGSPYIGITGITSAADVLIASRCVQLVPPTHRLMAGVLASAKTLRGEAVVSRRYPPFCDVERLLAALASAGAWPVVHFNCREALAFHLGALAMALPSMRGLQLNLAQMPAPEDVALFRVLRPDVEVILQWRDPLVTPQSLDGLRGWLARYGGSAGFTMLDASQGEGRPLAPGDAALCVTELVNGALPHDARLGLAGGLGPAAGPTLRELRRTVGAMLMREVSLDAESGLRVPVADPTPGEKGQDALDEVRALEWVRLAAEVVRG